MSRQRTFFGAVAGVLTALAVMLGSPMASPAVTSQDALHVRVRSELATFTTWLSDNGASGFIGEVGWPDDVRGDAEKWNALAETWYRDADAAGLWVTAWATGEWWPNGYPLLVYENRNADAGVHWANTQASVIEAHPSNGSVLRGVNVAGAEFAAPAVDATSSFSNANPGVYDSAYHYDSQATFDYLAGPGVKLVRLPFRWERLQPDLRAPLDSVEVERLRDAVARAHAAGLRVVLDMHNYGGYYLDDGTRGVRRTIGSAQLPVTHFADVWRRISQVFTDDPAIAGYGLMNEPVGLDDDLDRGTRNGALLWETASQTALAAIRLTGDDTMVMVPGYFWSGVQSWTRFHPDAWIVDPLDRHRYEAHHYWDADSGGSYPSDYDAELAAAGGSARPDEPAPER